jgi:Ca2+-binding EF-hand superfamily protein
VPSNSRYGDDYVSKAEYRFLLKYIREYYEYWIIFDMVDNDDDRRVSYTEFLSAVPTLESWSIDMSNPEEQWRQCDADGHGMVLFSEFAEWAIRKNFDLQEDD